MEFKYNKISFCVCVCVFFSFCFSFSFLQDFIIEIELLNSLVNKYNKNSVAGNELVSEFGPCGDSFVLFVCSLFFYCGLGE